MFCSVFLFSLKEICIVFVNCERDYEMLGRGYSILLTWNCYTVISFFSEN